MATPAPTITTVGSDRDGSVMLAKWTLTTADHTGAHMPAAEWADRSIQVEGTFGAATIKIEGSNDGTNFVALSNPQGTEISFTAAGLKQILEVTQFIRPRLTTVGSGATINAHVLLRRANPMRT